MSNVVSNVVSLRPRGAVRAVPAGRDTAAAAASLVALAEGLREASERCAALGGPALEVEMTVQLLFDATAAVERALDLVTDGGARCPF
jgi:hypothetical protein